MYNACMLMHACMQLDKYMHVHTRTGAYERAHKQQGVGTLMYAAIDLAWSPASDVGMPYIYSSNDQLC